MMLLVCLRTDTMMTSTFSPSKPEYYLYTFPDDVDSVVVKAVSDDSRCMILSVQDTKVCNSLHSLSIHVYIGKSNRYVI